ncbi:transcriptional regulator [Alcaligenes phenolicus]|uniref:Transcriptional regulator n=1 Tax=Alcaligenes phenolicus TaxID=232846 RepID=A0AAW5VW51_9BURK|nr:transcriptional regulator [Alcaligenes phenolicus]MCX5566762.1 transcriptional regulator [Alcaligenes phenolicus]
MYFKHSVKRLSQAGQNTLEEGFRNFPERIKLAIEQAGGAQKLAEKVGVSLLILQGWQSGKTEPSRLALIELAKASKLPIQWLACGEERFDKQAPAPSKPNVADMDSLEEIILKIRRLFVQQQLSLRSRAEAQAIRLVYEFYLHQGRQMDDASLDSLIERLAPQ